MNIMKGEELQVSKVTSKLDDAEMDIELLVDIRNFMLRVLSCGNRRNQRR